MATPNTSPFNSQLFGSGAGSGPTPPPTPGGLTVRNGIIYVALRIAGILNNARRTPSPEEVLDAFDALNTFIDSDSIERLMAYSITRNIQTLKAGQQDYLIGTGAPDWNFPRPPRIENAEFLFQGVAYGPLKIPMRILTAEDWEHIPLLGVPSTVCWSLYYEPTIPFGTAHLWPVPQNDAQIGLYLWQTLTQFITVDDFVVAPPGYLEYLQYQLALIINDRWPRAMMKPSAIERAREMKRRVKHLNRPWDDIACDPGTVGHARGTFDWRTGMIRSGGGSY